MEGSEEVEDDESGVVKNGNYVENIIIWIKIESMFVADNRVACDSEETQHVIVRKLIAMQKHMKCNLMKIMYLMKSGSISHKKNILLMSRCFVRRDAYLHTQIKYRTTCLQQQS